MALTTEQEIKQYVAKNWKEFETNYQIEKKFGLDVLKNRFSNENQGLNAISSNEILSIISSKSAEISKDLASYLESAYKLRQNVMTPRAKQRPEQVNENKLDQDLTSGSTRKAAPWADKIDFASDPNIRRSVEQIANATNKQEFTTAFDQLKAELANKLKNEHKNRLTAQMRYRPSASPKPERP